ncbi:hypothetical protein HJC23_010317 [Cyclotella cryptica]|uniref:Uncharacterized protein n=1 Tax=Cyclotella cryptica TaxID=29204 RepID=A0ABD3QPA4_9STRA|eukprot:CCRYP_003722-RA/>CCRYP_003722-RA protein AED:0.06 eAED:0.06 QI:0/-1/0/1/-1/1/1/0/569
MSRGGASSFSNNSGGFGGGGSGTFGPGFDVQDWGGSNPSRSSSCSSLELAASLFPNLQSFERASNNVGLLNELGNRRMSGNLNFNYNGQQNYPNIGVGMGSRDSAALFEGILQRGNGNDVTLEDMQRFLSSRFFHGNRVETLPSGPGDPTLNLTGLASSFHQMQRQIEMQRQTELQHLLLLQHQQQGAPLANSTGRKPQLHQQYNPVSYRRSGSRSSQGSISSVSAFGHRNSFTGRNWTQEKAEESARTAVPTENVLQADFARNDGMDKMLFVRTKDPFPLSLTKPNDGETNSLQSENFPPSVVTVASSTNSNSREFKRQRTNSSSSFEALLSAFGDDLAEIDKETSESNADAYDDENRSSWCSSNSFAFKKGDMDHLDGIFCNDEDTPDASRSNTPSQDLALRQAELFQSMALRHFMSQANPSILASQAIQTNLANMSRNSVQRRESVASGHSIELAMKRLSSVLKENSYVNQSSSKNIPPDDPRRQLDIFLTQYGETGKKARERMLKAIEDTESSLAKIHAWDRSLGLRKCHNRTVVKTRRSRAQIKAFLLGAKPPKEPKQRPKKAR